MSRLVQGEDAGGPRWFLDGKPVHCGTGLELRLPGISSHGHAVRQLADRFVPSTERGYRKVLGEASEALLERWVRVTFEQEGPEVPVLYLHLGGAWESWTLPPGTREGDEIRVRCHPCEGIGRLEVGDQCEVCGGKGQQGRVVRARETGVVLSRQAPCGDCVGGRVQRARACTDCDGKGFRWQEVIRPGPDTVPLRGLEACDLRWPEPSR